MAEPRERSQPLNLCRLGWLREGFPKEVTPALSSEGGTELSPWEAEGRGFQVEKVARTGACSGLGTGHQLCRLEYHGMATGYTCL